MLLGFAAFSSETFFPKKEEQKCHLSSVSETDLPKTKGDETHNLICTGSFDLRWGKGSQVLQPTMSNGKPEQGKGGPEPTSSSLNKENPQKVHLKD